MRTSGNIIGYVIIENCFSNDHCCYINLQVSTTEDDGGEDGSAGSSPTGGVVSSAVAASGASQAVQTISINGQQYQIVSPAPIGNTHY